MITCPVYLDSAITGRRSDLGTLVIDNIGGDRTTGDYRVRMYRKGALDKCGGHGGQLISTCKPIREGRVLGHKRLAEPVSNLVAKALKELGYG